MTVYQCYLHVDAGRGPSAAYQPFTFPALGAGVTIEFNVRVTSRVVGSPAPMYLYLDDMLTNACRVALPTIGAPLPSGDLTAGWSGSATGTSTDFTAVVQITAPNLDAYYAYPGGDSFFDGGIAVDTASFPFPATEGTQATRPTVNVVVDYPTAKIYVDLPYPTVAPPGIDKIVFDVQVLGAPSDYWTNGLWFSGPTSVGPVDLFYIDVATPNVGYAAMGLNATFWKLVSTTGTVPDFSSAIEWTTQSFAQNSVGSSNMPFSLVAGPGELWSYAAGATAFPIQVILGTPPPPPPSPPVVALQTPPTGWTIGRGYPVRLAAVGEYTGGPLATVEFFDGVTSVGVATRYPHVITHIPTVAGAHSITAKVTTADSRTATSTAATLTVTAGTTSTLPGGWGRQAA